MTQRVGGETRRSLLAGSAAGAAALLAGCGAGHPARQTLSPFSLAQDIALLNGALAAEQRTVALYVPVTALLSGFAQKAADHFLGQEVEHTGILRKLLKRAGEPVAKEHRPLAHYDFPQAHGQRELLIILHEAERRQIAVFLHAIPRLANPKLRQELASIMANDAQHITVLRVVLGLPPLTGPFLTAAE